MTKISLYKTKLSTRSNPKRMVWQLRWLGLDGKRYCETLGDAAKLAKKDADYLRREKQARIGTGLEPRDKPGRMGLAEFLRLDREAVSIDVKPKTIEEQRIAADHAVRALGESFDIRKLDHAAVGRIKRHLADRKLAAATISKTIQKLSAAFTRGVERRQLVSNPFVGVRLPKSQAKPVRIYKPCEVAAMIEAAPSVWWRCLIQLAHTSGLRRGEMLNLLWTDVDLDAGVVRVQAKRAGTFKAGGEDYPIVPWTAKTYDDRAVPIPPATVKMLREFRAFQEPPRSAYVFLSLERLAQIRRELNANDGKLGPNYVLVRNMRRDLLGIQKAAAARCAADDPDAQRWEVRTLHDLRRSYGTLMAERVPMHCLKALLGHSTIRTTERFYLAVGDDLAARVRAAFA